jgi:hypothetical protein
MTAPTERILNWRVTSVSTYLFETNWFTVTLEQYTGGGPQGDDIKRIEYVTDSPPRVGATVRPTVTEIAR